DGGGQRHLLGVGGGALGRQRRQRFDFVVGQRRQFREVGGEGTDALQPRALQDAAIAERTRQPRRALRIEQQFRRRLPAARIRQPQQRGERVTLSRDVVAQPFLFHRDARQLGLATGAAFGDARQRTLMV